VSARYRICAARSAGQAGIAHDGARTGWSSRTTPPKCAGVPFGTPIFAERNLGYFRSNLRKDATATKQNTVMLCRSRGMSADMRPRRSRAFR
jgi:hypothetical protein